MKDEARDIERFVVGVSSGDGVENLAHSEDLLAADLIDSLAIAELVKFLEEQYGIGVTDEDLNPDNFRSIDAIAAFVDRKRG